ncbi:MAG: insulinase family protein [Bacteroides sp.]|nr:insulinase family protein [Bacteroides sp.]
MSRLTIALPGGEAESPKPGLAACAALMLIEGTKRMTGEEIANMLEYNGAWVNTSVSLHYSSVILSSLNDKFADLLPVLADIIMFPTFPETATANILQRQAAKIDIEHEKVAFLADKAIRPLAYGEDNPLARTETSSQIKSFTSAELSDFHYSRIDPANIHVFLAGNITDKMVRTVDMIFSRFPAHKGPELRHIIFPPFPTKPERVDINVEHARQSAVKMMIPTIGRSDNDFVPLRAAVIALGGYFGSRLMLNIREDKGLTYGISAVLIGYVERSFVTIATQTDGSTKEEVINLIGEEIEKMKDVATYTDDEIKRLSKFILSNLATTLDTPFSRMDYVQTHIFADTPDDYFEQQESLARKLTPEILAEMARKYFDRSKMIIATAGN